MTTQSNQTGTYKGRKYRVLYVGKTKYGQRAHLQFFDGTKDFWVPAENVTVTEQASRAQQSRYDREDDECELCGKNKWTCGHCIGW